jgi:ADP-dependent NAD(P)H-hydrate dehydratase
MVVDADALNALAMDQDALLHPGGPRIVTPHVGEFRRLIAADIPAAECRDRAIEFANDAGLIVVMKGHQTRVTDGARTHDNQTGNPGMASGGAGDVLTGVITALLGQGLTPWEAALLGVHVHGLAGDLAKASTGEISLAATDIKDFLALAFQQVGDVA